MTYLGLKPFRANGKKCDGITLQPVVLEIKCSSYSHRDTARNKTAIKCFGNLNLLSGENKHMTQKLWME